MKKHFKALLPVLLLTGLLFGLSMTASAEDSKEGYWVQNGDRWWFQCTDDWYPTNGLYEIDGVGYAFDQWGYMMTGWWQDEYDNYYYFDLNSGAMQKGWVWDGAWYYMDPEYGFMYYDGYFWIDETSYLLRPDGSMVSGWYYYDYDPTDEWEGRTIGRVSAQLVAFRLCRCRTALFQIKKKCFHLLIQIIVIGYGDFLYGLSVLLKLCADTVGEYRSFSEFDGELSRNIGNMAVAVICLETVAELF